MLLTNTVRGTRQLYGSRSAEEWVVTPKPGLEVRGSPSDGYFSVPMALSRLASLRASHPADMRSQPVVGFQVV
jgi:hypothetical protein